MSLHRNLQRDILIMNMDDQIEDIAREMYNRPVSRLTTRETYEVVVALTKRLMDSSTVDEGRKKVYYLSPRFTLGKLLSNNISGLGIDDWLEGVLASKGKSLASLTKLESESHPHKTDMQKTVDDFLDYLAAFGLPGEGIGLVDGCLSVKDREEEKTIKGAESGDNPWLSETDTSYDVFFGEKKVTARLYDIDVMENDNAVNKLRLFSPEFIDNRLVQWYKSDFSSEKSEEDSGEGKGRYFLADYVQQYFMVSSAARLILSQMKEMKYDLRMLNEHALILIDNSYSALIIPELVRILVEDKAFTVDEAIDVVTKTCVCTDPAFLVKAMEEWPLSCWEETIPQMVPVITELDKRMKEQTADQGKAS
jgi:starch phosphorylase